MVYCILLTMSAVQIQLKQFSALADSLAWIPERCTIFSRMNHVIGIWTEFTWVCMVIPIDDTKNKFHLNFSLKILSLGLSITPSISHAFYDLKDQCGLRHGYHQK